MQENRIRKMSRSMILGTMIAAAGMAGCSMFNPSNAPIDCNVVRTQAAAGLSDAKIAANLNANYDPGEQRTQVTVEQVAACHGPESSGNKNAGMAPSNY